MMKGMLMCSMTSVELNDPSQILLVHFTNFINAYILVWIV